MTKDKTLLSSFSPRKWGFVFEADNNKVKIIDIGIVFKFPSPTIGEVNLVDGLNHHLLSISQLCDKGNSVTFDSYGCRVIKSKCDQTIFATSRSGNIYTVNLNKIP